MPAPPRRRRRSTSELSRPYARRERLLFSERQPFPAVFAYFLELAENFFILQPFHFVGSVIDSGRSAMVHSIHNFIFGKGVDGEKYRGRSVSVSGGQWKPRNKESVGRTLRSCNLNAGPPPVSATSCDRYLTRACWSLEGGPPGGQIRWHRGSQLFVLKFLGCSCAFCFWRCCLCVPSWVFPARP